MMYNSVVAMAIYTGVIEQDSCCSVDMRSCCIFLLWRINVMIVESVEHFDTV